MPTETVHLCPTAARLTHCCDRTVAKLRGQALVTTDPQQATCTVRAVAEIPVDLDDGDNPFGWSDNEAKDKTPALARVLRAVRRQRLPEAPTASTIRILLPHLSK